MTASLNSGFQKLLNAANISNHKYSTPLAFEKNVGKVIRDLDVIKFVVSNKNAKEAFQQFLSNVVVFNTKDFVPFMLNEALREAEGIAQSLSQKETCVIS